MTLRNDGLVEALTQAPSISPADAPKGRGLWADARARFLRNRAAVISLLVLAHPQGPTCHNGTTSCFPQAPGDVVAELDAVIAQRKADASAASYTRKLFDAGIARIAQKVGEEGVETALAAVTADDASLRGEAADLVYHLLVLLQARGLDWNVVRTELARRAKG